MILLQIHGSQQALWLPHAQAIVLHRFLTAKYSWWVELISNDFLSTCELYDPATNSWNVTGSLVSARYGHSAVLLQNGKVWVAGGYGDPPNNELYDPTTNSWSPGGSLLIRRAFHSATLLTSGKVLVAGGQRYDGDPIAELYDPSTNNWIASSAMDSNRNGHSATLLSNGKVLVAGGSDKFGDLSTCDLYDPATNKWNVTGAMADPRTGHTATLLSSGKVLVTGGRYLKKYGGYITLDSAEVYDPTTNSWNAETYLSVECYEHSATLLPSGKVLVTGERIWYP